MSDHVLPNVSPLARRLADTHDVDLSALARGPEDKITARSVLEHLSATTEPAKRRGEPRTTPDPQPTPENASEAATVADNAPDGGLTVLEHPTEPDGQDQVVADEPHVLKTVDPALERTRLQLQATAQVHQQALMQVGSLRERNSALEHETERLRTAEAQAQAEVQRLAEQKAQLERDLERSKTGAFGWLKKLIS